LIFYRKFCVIYLATCPRFAFFEHVIEFETKVRLRVGNSDLWRRRFAAELAWVGVRWGLLLGNNTLKNNVYGKI
jgi:hypothetical protein